MAFHKSFVFLLLWQLWALNGLTQIEEGTLDHADDDECSLAGTERPSCALNALQRRGHKTFSDSVVPPVQKVSKNIIKGISYGPMPCKDGNCDTLMDDFMTEAAKPLWGPKGRGDLKTISQMGANTVRLYGNSPTEDHSSFLDEAHAQKLKVVVGISDYPYTQMKFNCLHNGFNCYEMVKAMYKLNLLKGFVQDEEAATSKSYHPALSTVIVLNEPDLKMPGMGEPRKFVKAIISGLDGILDAEKEVGVSGNLVNFTATFSFGVCANCLALNNKPGLGQMAQLEDAMLHPEAYGYTPKNDLASIYHTRWTHSFNTAAPAKFVHSDFVSIYEEKFLTTPVAILEYHTPYHNAFKDLSDIYAIAEKSPLLLGACFFEFQVRYDKGGSEMAFGMFGLGGYSFGEFNYYGDDFGSWCLTEVKDQYGSMPQLVAKAMGGKGPEWSMLCAPDPAKVPLNAEGFSQIASQGPERVAVFYSRIVRHLGGVVTNMDGLVTYASDLKANGAAQDTTDRFGESVGELANPAGFASAWVKMDANAKCVADRDSDAGKVGAAVGWACGQAKNFDCNDMPVTCKGSVWATADWVFTNFYAKEGAGSPLENCYFGGVAVLAASDYVGRKCGGECCSYSGAASSAPTMPPTLPPKFDPEYKSTTSGAPTPSPAIAGDCSFEHAPALSYFWDTRCKPRGGPGCNADGRHMECRFCGSGPFPACPSGPGDLSAEPASAPSPPPGPPSSVVGDCEFANQPALPYFWDKSCLPHGGPGCNGDGKHMACRFCGRAPFPDCPSQG